MMLRTVGACATALAIVLAFAGCTGNSTEMPENSNDSTAVLEHTSSPLDDTSQSSNATSSETGAISGQKESEMRQISITVNGQTVTATLEDNSSAQAFVELLEQSDLTLQLEDYGGFEKVGPLGQSLPANDANITTMPGDIILYQGDKLTIYYDVNSWSFTKLGHINEATGESMRALLGDKNVEVMFSLNKD